MSRTTRKRGARPVWILPPLMLAPGWGRRFSPSASGGRTRNPEEPALKPFFEASTDPMLTLDSGHVVLDANAAALRFLGVPRDRVVGASALEIDLLARLLTAGSILQRLKTDPPPIADEIMVSDSEGQAVQCRLEAIPFTHGRVVLHLHDTTAVLRARAAQHSAERLQHAVFDALPEVAWTMALPEERLLEVSPAVERLFGYQPSAFREHPELWNELVHPADRERVRDELRRGISGGRPFEIHFTGMHRDHHDLPHLVNRVIPVSDERGWVDRCEGLIEDRGSEHKLEATLRDTEANLRHTLDAVASGVLVVRPGERGVEVAVCNRRMADMLKLDEPIKPGTPLAQAPDALRAVAYGSNSESGFERRLLSEEIRDEVAEFQDPHRVLRRFAGPVRDAYGGVMGRIVTVEDVTSSYLMHRRLTYAQKMESMGRLAGGVAHDFNNLLGTMLGFGALLLEQTPEDDARREPLTEIVQAAERASRLTQALLSFSRSARFERLPVQLNRVIEDSYQLVRSAVEPSVAIELRLDSGLPNVLGDALLIQQTLVNLVQEVRDRLTPGGVLHIATRIADPASIPTESGADAEERMAVLEISVSTPPAPGEHGLATVDHAPDRAGLALTMVEDVMRAHGGFLETGSATNGALFGAYFPVNAPEETPLIIPDSGIARGHETILVVDDEAGLRTLAKTGLQQRGFRVITAENGEQALQILRGSERPVDLVLLDLSMPGLSGERVLKAIRSFKPDLPVIIASGYATVESQTAWNAAGAQGFVAKPYRVQDVANKLREVLDRAHGRVSP